MKKLLVMLTVMALLFAAAFTGCTKEAEPAVTEKPTEAVAQTTEEADPGEENQLPEGRLVAEPLTLTMWFPFTSDIIDSANDNVVFQTLEEITGVHIDFVHPPSGEEDENFNLMLASNDLTDMFRNPRTYPGGNDKGVDDGFYVDLATLLNEEYAPNLTLLMQEYPEIKRQTYNDDGVIWGLPQIQLSEEPAWSGPLLRQDWLEDLNLEVPETIADWEEVLIAFRDNIETCEAPMLLSVFDWKWGSNCAFASAYDSSFDGRNLLWLNKDGEVAFGPAEPGYKDFLTLFSNWYAEGLIDPDFASRDGASYDAMITSGKSGAFITAYGGITGYVSAGQTDDADFAIVAAASPVAVEGGTVHIRQKDSLIKDNRGVITTQCEYPEIAMQWFDYGYSTAGLMLYSYGVEGVSYELKTTDDWGLSAGFMPKEILATNMKPEFTEIMTNNPDGYDFWKMADKYKVHNGPYLRNPHATILAEAALDAMEKWNSSGSDWVMPPVSLNSEESSRYGEIMSNVKTYYEEMTLKFIAGIEPMDNFDQYITDLKLLGIEEAAEIQQAALDRYNQR